MSERYQKLNSLPENLYAPGAPVIIAAGSLLKDQQRGVILAQLKLKSIVPGTIKAVKVKLSPLDTVGKPLGEGILYEYLDIAAQRDAEFGQKSAISFPNASTRAFRAEVTEVAFADNTVWSSDGSAWEPLEKAEAITEPELLKQYRLRYGALASVRARRERNLWICACGAVNADAEKNCHTCSNSAFEVLNCDFEALEAEKLARLAREEEEQKQRMAEAMAKADEQARKLRNVLKVAIPAAVAVAAAAVVITQVVLPNMRYNQALALKDSGAYEEAIAAFKAMEGYKDSAAEIELCNELIVERDNAYAYSHAEEMLASGRYEEAIKEFRHIIGYRDARDRYEEAKDAEVEARYQKAVQKLEDGQYWEAIQSFRELRDYADSKNKIREALKVARQAIQSKKGLIACSSHIIAVVDDNRVLLETDKDGEDYGVTEARNWTDIIAIDATYDKIIGLRSDGTAVAAGRNRKGECNVSGWSDIIAVDIGVTHSVGLRSDGTVVAAGDNEHGECNVDQWTDIIAVAAGDSHTVGLRSDGTVVAAGETNWGQCDVVKWSDIVAISANDDNTVGLRGDGTVVAVGDSINGANNVRDWKDVIEVCSGGWYYTTGLIIDGTVVVAGEKNSWDDYDPQKAASWKDIVSLSANYGSVAGLKTDGGIIALGDISSNVAKAGLIAQTWEREFKYVN